MRPRQIFNPLVIAATAVGLFSALSVGPATILGAGGGGRPPRPWPLDIPIHLSSSFGEYRTGHLHAGVDIRTFGREGVPCRAVGDGWISRLRSSPFGYGQALYLTLDTGETVVYAHLSEFSPPLDSVICAAQQAAGRYRVDIYRDRGEIPVRAGEILGYTGRTGSAAPHLHFEVRDGSQNPVDPLSVGWELEDGECPRIYGVGWVPIAPSARIGGVCAPVYEKLEKIGASRFAARDTIRLEGRVGLSARIVDRLGPSSGKLAPYRVELLVDDRLVAAVELKSFTYEHTREVELAYDMERARAAGLHYLFLFERDGETLWNRFFENGGVIDTDSLTAGVHTAVVRAIDRGGNISTATLPFAAGARPPVRAVQPVEQVAGGELPGCFFLDGLFTVKGDVVAGESPPTRETPEEKGDPDTEIDLTGSDAGSYRTEGRKQRAAAGDASHAADRTETAGRDRIVTVAGAAGPWTFGLAAGETAREIYMFPVKSGSEVSGSAVLPGGGGVYFGSRDGSFYS
ncbi:MAG: M23 family metallopeptidase, partial [bacterium]